MKAVLVCLMIVLSMPLSSFASQDRACPTPESLQFKEVRRIHRQERGFTQGLEVFDNKLFESTGSHVGRSRVNVIESNGRVRTLVDHGKAVFGEGLTILNSEVFQLTWKDNKMFVYDSKGRLLRTLAFPYEGWGLTNDGNSLLFTDGSETLYFANPKDLSIQRRITLRTENHTLNQINELEYVDGKVYGNQFMTNFIFRFDPKTGCAEAVIDMTSIIANLPKAERDHMSTNPNFVLNGIAYNSKERLFYLTGKYWDSILVGRFEKLGK